MRLLVLALLLCSVSIPAHSQTAVPDSLSRGATFDCYRSVDKLRRGDKVSTTRFEENSDTLAFFREAYQRSHEVFVDLFKIQAGDVTLMKTEYVLKRKLDLKAPYLGLVVTMLKESEPENRLELLFEMAPNTEALLLKLETKTDDESHNHWVCEEYYERK